MDKPQNTKTTVTLDVPPEWAIGLKGEIVRGFEAVEKRLDAIETNVDLQGSTVRDVQKRMTAQEERMNAMETRQNLSSERVQQTSQADLGHDAAIAQIKVAVEELAKRPDTGEQVLAALDKLSERPLVKKLTGAIVPVLLVAIALLGARLQAQLSKLEATPAPIYQPDGGAK